ncbi:MAG: hypothetical protein K9H16_08580 [Bacteroidales bacterium]|nr:hypothetical protein [Bacteroidales bacterium]
MNLKFIIIWTFFMLLSAAGISQKSSNHTTRNAGGIFSGRIKTMGGVPKGNIKGMDTDPVPGNNGLLNNQDIGNGNVRVGWTPATDLETESSQLQYVVCATIWPIFDLEVLESDYRIDEYEKDISFKYAELTMGDTWNIFVIVKDEAGNRVLYEFDTLTTSYNEVPVPWRDSRIGWFCIVDFYDQYYPHECLPLWRSATDDSTPVTELEYLVYYSLEDNLSNLEEIERNGTPFGNFQTFTGVWEEDSQTYYYTNHWITGLEANTKYYFRLVVKDSEGGKAIHRSAWNTTDIDDPPIAGDQGEILTNAASPVQINLDWAYGWDDITVHADLEYLVYYSTSDNISTVDSCITYGTPFGSFAANIDTAQVTGLKASTIYYFNVVIRDGAGFMSSYNMVNDTTEIDDPPMPGGSGEISTTVAGTTQINLNWSYGNDDKTAQADLEYLVYYSTSDNITTVDSCETNGTPFGTFTANINSGQVTGLTPNTDYFFNVVIKDASLNKSAYSMVNDTTDIDYPPTPGGSGEIQTTVAGTTQINLSWTYGTDDITAQADLEYLGYYSTSDNISTVDSCEANGTPLGTFAANINSGQATGLTPNKNYYFNVVIKDVAGNKSVYNMVNDTTEIDYPPTPGESGEILTTVAGFTQINLSWAHASDDLTPQADLEYLVYYSTSDNITTVNECEANGTAYGSFAANINSKQVTGLTISTNYYFNIVVKDGMGFKNAYNVVNDTTDTDYPPTPGNSGVISSTYTGISQVNLSWDYATDDFSPQANLKYLVYYSDSDNIATVSQCETNGTPAGSFTENMNSKSVNGLTSGTTWYFNIVVKDIPGYKSVYQMAGFTTLITDDPPVAGNSGIIEVGTVTTSEVTLSWTKATDNASLQANLKYLVYYSTVDNLGTVTDCENNGTAFGTYANDIATQTITSLAQDTKYYFNIVVKDEGNNKTCYQTCNATTDKASVLAIGSLYEGGIVIYLDDSGGGLVCALTDQSTSAEWGCYNTALTGCEDQSIGAGQANTTAIIAGCSTAGIAARICDAYDDGTYSDWFLPSFNEGQEIKNNLSAINNGLTANGGDTFTGDYWTSTQASWDQKGIRPDRNLDAWTIFGGPPFADKNASLRVRAVRKF